MDPAIYRSRKADRRQAQLDVLATVMALPARAHAGALFALWPRKLPRVVRSFLDHNVLAQWRALREAVEDRREQEFMEYMHHMMHHMQDDGMLEALVEIYEEPVSQLMNLIDSVSDLQTITLLGEDMALQFDLATQTVEEGILRVGLAMAMDQGAGLTLRQKLPLRVQLPDEQGQMQWRHQNRIYGIFMGEGEWSALSETEVRQAYMTDHESGETMERDPTVVFGDARPLERLVRRTLKGA